MTTAEASPVPDLTRHPRGRDHADEGPWAIALTGLTKAFGAVHAVRRVDLRVRRGEVVALLGPNGAGKTTTIDLVLGLAEPDAGLARVFWLDPSDAIACGLVSAVMQTGGLLKDLTVRETVGYTASLFATGRPAAEVLATVGLTQIAGRRVGACSGGEQQRLRFAMALVPDPQLIILDEPTTGMDVSARRSFWSAIRTDAARGRTVIFATHYLEEADAYADRVVLMHQGEVVADGTAAHINALAGARHVTAVWPAADGAALHRLPGVTGVQIRGHTLTVTGTDSDSVARSLLTQTPATDLEIVARGLEDAFVALTTDDVEEDLR
ncbi:ABC transporter ATP-binding protein [Cellulomonas sp. P24]|uniref:ABC transporter ATP-binding protein n=1 Tax=Cellulomonas sp. P24 TaxID=2885206 RepID=UPI00216AED29|nr:ABC transporter ATP-binding protein [Cellulomonas sp. P24]MCR6491116.1 ABC transporter ATP-binding protein [Cellulomonas sp. P24]